MKTICASLLFVSFAATTALAVPARNNPFYTSRNYKQPYSAKWQDEPNITRYNRAIYHSRQADYKHPLPETNLAIGSLAAYASPYDLVSRNYKQPQDVRWQSALSRHNDQVGQAHKHHPHAVGH